MKMARGKTRTLVISVAVAAAAALLCPTFFSLLPPLQPLTSQLLQRLREVSVFLIFTTAITVCILTSQRKDASQDVQNNSFLEHHTVVGSIFEEPDFSEADPFNEHSAGDSVSLPAPGTRPSEQKLRNGFVDGYIAQSPLPAADGAYSPGIVQINETTTTAQPVERLRAASEDDGAFVSKQSGQRRLHRKSSSVDDGVKYVPEVEALKASVPEPAFAKNDVDGVSAMKPMKRVSFYMPPLSPKHVMSDQTTRHSISGLVEKDRDLNARSAGDLMGQADAFIAKFKEQLRMQNLESVQNYQS